MKNLIPVKNYKEDISFNREINTDIALSEFMCILEISVDCIGKAIKKRSALPVEIAWSINNYAKKKINTFIKDNKTRLSVFSFRMFGNNMHCDSKSIYCRIYNKSETEMCRGNHENNKLKDCYKYDTRLNIAYSDTNISFHIFINSPELYESLYKSAKKKIKSDKKNPEMKARINQANMRLEKLKTKLNKSSQLMASYDMKEYLVKWHSLLWEYINKASLLLSDTDDIRTLETKELAYVLKKIFQHKYKVDVGGKPFKAAMVNALGIDTETVREYIDDNKNFKDETFTERWLNILTLIDSLNAEDNEIKILMQHMLEDKYVQKDHSDIKVRVKINDLMEKYKNDRD